MSGFCYIHSVRRADRDLTDRLVEALPDGATRRIVIKPNWVCHQSDPEFPIAALVTSTDLIVSIIEACIRRYADLEEILVADVPIQSCDWLRLVHQAGIERLVARFGGLARPRVTVRDLRASRVRSVKGYLVEEPPSAEHGDPKGFADIVLDHQSFLEATSDDSASFRVADYSPEETKSSHRKGFHRYRVARSLLECDLFINAAKMKTHQKAGITGALKNVVGINVNKAYLVHYREGGLSRGDEFPPDIAWPVVLQSRVRRWALGRSRPVFGVLRTGWRGFRQLYGLETKATRDRIGRPFVLTGGSWYGNDSIWRMIYDLNRVILHGRPEGGELASEPQRRYLAVVDGITAGEGNGPLQPLPVEAGIVAISDNPFLADFALSRLMGFDAKKIPQLAHHREFGAKSWGDFDPASARLHLDGRELCGIEALAVLRVFLPPAGWREHIELAAASRVA
ncbi:MAG TPA: DUF362 domain-containing protein [Candidatus Polarisedimenticolia bacterium]|nr:DUF362 domain-containing protein [Candidatus Polarisedimenticolia bacterium]